MGAWLRARITPRDGGSPDLTARIADLSDADLEAIASAAIARWVTTRSELAAAQQLSPEDANRLYMVP